MDETEMHWMVVFATTLRRMKTASEAGQPVQLSAEENEVMVYIIRLLSAKEKIDER